MGEVVDGKKEKLKEIIGSLEKVFEETELGIGSGWLQESLSALKNHFQGEKNKVYQGLNGNLPKVSAEFIGVASSLWRFVDNLSPYSSEAQIISKRAFKIYGDMSDFYRLISSENHAG